MVLATDGPFGDVRGERVAWLVCDGLGAGTERDGGVALEGEEEGSYGWGGTGILGLEKEGLLGE